MWKGRNSDSEARWYCLITNHTTEVTIAPAYKAGLML